MIRPDMATMLAFLATDAAVPRELLPAIVCKAPCNTPSTPSRSTAIPPPTTPACWSQPAPRRRAHGSRQRGRGGLRRRGPRRLRGAGDGHRPRRRGRDQARHRRGRRVRGRRRGARASPTPSRTRRWSRRRCSPPIPTGAVSSPRSGGPASPGSTSRACASGSTTPASSAAAAATRTTPRPPGAVMAQDAFRIRVALGRGAAAARVLTCDLSYDYVRINAEYRT
jgi:hypothetical protein